jgi:tetratricopeptide (TPR) repeat protein/tRNA A-37 threonylcarbamoyl transferase component Bud32
MNDDTLPNSDARPLAVLARVDKVCDRFEAAWPDPGRPAPRPRIEDYLGETLEPERSQLLTQLLALELEYRRAAGEIPLLQDYRQRFPNHGEVVCRVFTVPETVPTQPTANLSATPPAPGDHSTLARFRPLRLHAEGGLGEVHVAEDSELHREVALKRIRDEYADDPDSRHRFLREAEITGGLEHPGIVPVYGLGQYADGRPYYAMRFIKGDSLKQAIERFHQAEGPKRDPGERTLALRELLGRFVAVCNVVAYAHSRGVLHRDLKPDNVMLGPYGETLVVDWGLAKPVGRPEDRKDSAEETLVPTMPIGAQPSQMGQVIGTPAYMAPEQAAGRLDQLGPASDVYSLGATLYCLLTGKAPFENREVWRILEKVYRGEFPPPRQINSSIPRPLSAICLKAMALKPEDRYASAQALADDMEHWLADEPVRAYREPSRVRAGRWVRRHKALVSAAGAAVLVAVVAGGAGIIWYQDEQNRRATEAALREAAEGRKLALAEQGVGDALKQAEAKRRELHTILRKPGGVFGLLNNPALWQAQIQAAWESLQRATALLANAGPNANPDLKRRLQRLEAEVGQDDSDRALAMSLEKIRLDRAVMVEGKFGFAHGESQYPQVFEQASLVMAPGRQKAAAVLIRQSAIKEQLLAAIDDWAYVAYLSKKRVLCAQLLEVARLVDPDPWRDKVRDLALWEQSQALVTLAEEAQADQKIMARLSPQILDLISELLPQGKREKWLRLAQALHAADFWINFDLGNVLQKMKAPMEAAGFYRVALALRPNTVAVYNNLAGALADKRDLPAAIDAFKKALAIEPKDALAWYGLGVTLAAQKDLPAAIDAYNKALAINPNFTFAWNNVGIALKGQKGLPAAIDAFKKALAIDPKNATTWNNLGTALAAQNDLPPAIAAFKNALVIEPKNAVVWYNLGVTLRDQEDLAAAIDAFRKALVIEPKFVMAWNNLGTALAEQKEVSAAIDAFKKALAIEPKNAVVWYNLGIALTEQKDLAAAIAAYKQALAIDCKDASAWANLGIALKRQKDLPAAIDAYKKSLAIKPKNAVVWYNLGIALTEQKDLAAAIAAYKQALVIEPKLAKAWLYLGIALRDKKDLRGAIDAYKTAIKIKPSYALGHGALGQALRDQGDFAGAVAATQRALQLLEKGDSLRPFLEGQLKNCQQLLSLERRLPNALKGEKLSPTGYLALADLCWRNKKRYTAAARLYAAAFAKEPRLADDLHSWHRYSAACVAALAAAGQGKDAANLDAQERSKLRQQALGWLQHDLAAWTKFAEKGSAKSRATVSEVLQHWQQDSDFAALRGSDALAKLPAEERHAWKKLWAEVDALLKRVQNK